MSDRNATIRPRLAQEASSGCGQRISTVGEKLCCLDLPLVGCQPGSFSGRPRPAFLVRVSRAADSNVARPFLSSARPLSSIDRPWNLFRSILSRSFHHVRRRSNVARPFISSARSFSSLDLQNLFRSPLHFARSTLNLFPSLDHPFISSARPFPLVVPFTRIARICSSSSSHAATDACIQPQQATAASRSLHSRKISPRVFGRSLSLLQNVRRTTTVASETCKQKNLRR